MEIAHLSEEEKKQLHQFEEKLGMVLVAYQPESTSHSESSSEDANPSLTSSSM
ncbi:MAG TPA: hypothetical protein VFH42_02610 [Sporolactobacillaceae bacterium]|nr:hypothetical protein [Sporolactobacillaceae bacterium]